MDSIDKVILVTLLFIIVLSLLTSCAKKLDVCQDSQGNVAACLDVFNKSALEERIL